MASRYVIQKLVDDVWVNTEHEAWGAHKENLETNAAIMQAYGNVTRVVLLDSGIPAAATPDLPTTGSKV